MPGLTPCWLITFAPTSQFWRSNLRTYMQDLKLCHTISPNFIFTTEDLILWRSWDGVQELFGASPQADKQISSNPTPPSPPAPIFTYAEMEFGVSYKPDKHAVTDPHLQASTTHFSTKGLFTHLYTDT